MTRRSPDTDDYEDDEQAAGPALARPPLSVLRAVTRCPECGRVTRVYALGCDGFREAGDSAFINDFFFLHHIRSLPGEVIAMLRMISPGYRFDTGERSGKSYLMNHCGCGARLDDDLLHGDAGAAFFPDTPAGFGGIKIIRRFHLQDDLPVEAAWTLGGGEHLTEECQTEAP